MNWRIWFPVLCLTGCGPLLAVEESTTDGGSTTDADSTSSSPEPPSGDCSPGVQQACGCPGASDGLRTCTPDGVFGSCVCPDVGTTTAPPPVTTGPGPTTFGSSSGFPGGVESSSSGWAESSSGSSSGGEEPMIPDLPPGETCLPLDMPCVWPFFGITSQEEMEAIATCSRLDGNLEIIEFAGPLDLPCLREVEQAFVFNASSLQSTQGLPLLESAEFLVFLENFELQTINLPSLQAVDGLFVFGNPELTSATFGDGFQISEQLEVSGNTSFPSCDVVDLADASGLETWACVDNFPDVCAKTCAG